MTESVGPLQQYFGRYTVEARDAALLEFEEALRQAGNQSQLYAQLVNVLVAVSTVVGSILAASKPESLTTMSQPQRVGLALVVAAILGLMLMFFAELQKTTIINARKVVTLRRALGIDYSRLHLTLPNWRIEGATNPFAIRFFPGWLSTVALPYWVTCALLVAIGYFFVGPIRLVRPIVVLIPWWMSAASACVVLALFFRHRLLDLHESMWLRLVYRFARMIRIGLLSDFGGILFRAKLAVSEMERLEYDLTHLKKVVVALEDARFYRHRGVDVRSLVRAVLSQVPAFRHSKGAARSGASTITMQLARTLLVSEYHKGFRRKIAEILLAYWLEREFSKDEILCLYLASVRFANGVFGVPAALRFFFGSSRKRKISLPEAFLLVERLSNVRNRMLRPKILAQLELAAQRDISLSVDAVLALYDRIALRGALESAPAAIAESA